MRNTNLRRTFHPFRRIASLLIFALSLTACAIAQTSDREARTARRAVADFQRNPVQLVKEFSLNKETRDLAFDLTLTIEYALGPDRWKKLEDKQRAAVIQAFEQTVRGLWETWDVQQAELVRIVRNKAKGSGRVVTLLRGETMLRLTAAQRDGAWFIVEHEIVDDAMPEFADAINGALRPDARRGRVYEIAFDAALAHLDRLIAAEGEKPELLLLKAHVLSQQQDEEEDTFELMDRAARQLKVKREGVRTFKQTVSLEEV